LTRKTSKYEWIDKCKVAFQELKRRLTSAPILAVPTNDVDYVVYSDAYKNGLVSVLMQTNHVTAYASQQLKPHEQNYPTTT